MFLIEGALIIGGLLVTWMGHYGVYVGNDDDPFWLNLMKIAFFLPPILMFIPSSQGPGIAVEAILVLITGVGSAFNKSERFSHVYLAHLILAWGFMLIVALSDIDESAPFIVVGIIILMMKAYEFVTAKENKN